MNIHKNARLTPHGRAEAVRRVEGGVSARQVAREARVTDKTVRRWVARAGTGAPLTDRSSRPHCPSPATPPAVALRVMGSILAQVRRSRRANG